MSVRGMLQGAGLIIPAPPPCASPDPPFTRAGRRWKGAHSHVHPLFSSPLTRRPQKNSCSSIRVEKISIELIPLIACVKRLIFTDVPRK
jgi:hypothetical protein